MALRIDEWVIFQDEHLLVINKPSGLPTLPDGYEPAAPYLRGLLELEFGRLWVVHRLDKDTSGIIVFARSARAHRSLNAQFEQHQVVKTYHALVFGTPYWEERIAEMPLRPDGDRRHRTVMDRAHGKPSLTELRVLVRFAGYTLMEALPRTGRTHQIRAHLSALGFPLAGDKLYGSIASSKDTLIARPALHALSLELCYPDSQKPLRFQAPYAADFEAVLQSLL